jgi:hypothetical protein
MISTDAGISICQREEHLEKPAIYLWRLSRENKTESRTENRQKAISAMICTDTELHRRKWNIPILIAEFGEDKERKD